MMKSFFKKLAFVMALAMVVSMAAPAATTASAASDLKIAYQNGKGYGITELNIAEVGATEDLKFLGAPSNWKELGATWTSNNEAVATVDQNGVVTAVAEGTAVIALQIGSDVATVQVNCVDVATYTATMGTADDRNITAKTIEEGDTFDFAFYGIKDYDVKRYFCTWASDDTSVATVDQKGLVEAVAPGTAKITLIVFNKVTGQVHNVDACTVTVPGKATPTPAVVVEPTVEIDGGLNKTELTFELNFNDFVGLDVSKIAKNEIEVYEQHIDEETGVEHLYIWQISALKKVDDDTLLVTGYTTNELIDGYDYVVKYVVPNADEEKVKTLAEAKFTASVGEVVKMTTSYASYKNNQGYYTFNDVAYTTAGAGEDIETKISYVLYDAKGVNVTGHYLRANDYQDLVTVELVTEDADYLFELEEEDNTLVFNDIPETPYVEFNVVYDDYVGEPVESTIKMIVKEAIPYKIASIDNWGINVTEGADAANTFDIAAWRKDIALYDDYDVIDMDPLENHEVVLWFTDNYDNRYVTEEIFAYDWCWKKVNDYKHYYYLTSERFMSEGYEIFFESKNPQVLVVGDEYDDATTSNVITTKKTGTATINITLQNAGLETIDRVSTIKVPVKAARFVKNIAFKHPNMKLTTDSIPTITVFDFATGTFTESNYVASWGSTCWDNRAGNDNLYDYRFVNQNQEIYVYDNHGDYFGRFNTTLFNSLSLSMEATNVNTANLDAASIGCWYHGAWNHTFGQNFDAVQITNTLITAGEGSVNTVKYVVTAEDAANEKEVNASFRVTLCDTDNDKTTGDVKVKSTLDLRAEGTYGYVSTKNLLVPITVVETSNGRDVNYADYIELIVDQERYDELFVDKTATASEGALFLAVFNPKGEIVNKLSANAEGDEWGLVQNESGNYEFHFADTKNAAAGTRFAQAGKYTVKLMEVTKTTSEDKVANNGVSTKTKSFKLKDDRLDVYYGDQTFIYVDYEQLAEFEQNKYLGDNGPDAIDEIAANAFTYSAALDNWPVMTTIGGVRYTVNEKANSVVLKDVFLKVLIDTDVDGKYDDETVWYYVEVEMPDGKTVSLEDADLVDENGSVDYRKDPDGRKVQ